MSTLLNIALGNALMASLFAALAILVGTVCKRPALTHALWLLVLIKLITPPLWTLPLRVRPLPAMKSVSPVPVQSRDIAPGTLPEVSHSAIGRAEVQRSAVLATSDPQSSVDGAAIVVLQPPDRDPLNLTAQAGELPPALITPSVAHRASSKAHPWQRSLPSWDSLLIGGAATGSVVFTLIIVMRLARFNHLLRYAASAPSDVRRLMESLAGQMGVTPPSLWMVPGAVCPMVFALGGTPRLLIPTLLWQRLDSVQQSALLVHELAHLHRRDHWIRWLEIVVTVLYWWHPAVWWARRELREAEEQCCDAWVVWMMPGANRPYSAALLEALEFVSAPLPAAFSNILGSSRGVSTIRTKTPVVPAWASGMGQFKQIRRRLIMIKTAQVSRRLTWTGLSSVFALGALLLPVAPGIAQSSATEVRTDAKAPAEKTVPLDVAPNPGEEAQVIEGLRTRPEKSEAGRKADEANRKNEAGPSLSGRGMVPADRAVEPGPFIPNSAKEPSANDPKSGLTPPMPTPSQPAAGVAGQDHDLEIQVARAEVHTLSAKLQDASRRLQDLEHVRSKIGYPAAKEFPSASFQKYPPFNGAARGGDYRVVTQDGKITTYSADGKIMSVAPMPAQSVPQGFVMPPAMSDLPGIAPSGIQVKPEAASNYAGVGSRGTVKQPQELERRIERLEAQLQHIGEELRSLHKEMSVNPNGFERSTAAPAFR